MKYFFTTILIAFGLILNAQNWTPIYNNQKIDGIWANKYLRMPTDTTSNKTGVVMLSNKFWIGDGVKWSVQSSDTGRGVSQLITGGSFKKVVDSLGILKLNISDTATMLTPYPRGSATSGQVSYWNGARQLTGSSTFTFTPTSALALSNSVTAASAIARGVHLTPTLIAAANSDFTIGLDISPIFTNGAFTNVTNIGLRLGQTSGTAFSQSQTGATSFFAGRLGIGSAAGSNSNIAVTRIISGASTSYGILVNGQVQTDVTGARIINAESNIIAGASVSDIPLFFASQGTLSSTPTNQYGYGVSSGLTGGTNNYAFHSNINSGTGRWNIYMNGSASNYVNGTFLVGTTTDDGINKGIINGSIRTTQYRLSALNTAPSSASDTGTLGEVRFTSTHIFLCTATNTWVRAAFATW